MNADFNDSKTKSAKEITMLEDSSSLLNYWVKEFNAYILSKQRPEVTLTPILNILLFFTPSHSIKKEIY